MHRNDCVLIFFQAYICATKTVRKVHWLRFHFSFFFSFFFSWKYNITLIIQWNFERNLQTCAEECPNMTDKKLWIYSFSDEKLLLIAGRSNKGVECTIHIFFSFSSCSANKLNANTWLRSNGTNVMGNVSVMCCVIMGLHNRRNEGMKRKNYTIRVFVMWFRFHLNERFQLKEETTKDQQKPALTFYRRF